MAIATAFSSGVETSLRRTGGTEGWIQGRQMAGYLRGEGLANSRYGVRSPLLMRLGGVDWFQPGR
jgi:hypothetical protein